MEGELTFTYHRGLLHYVFNAEISFHLNKISFKQNEIQSFHLKDASESAVDAFQHL